MEPQSTSFNRSIFVVVRSDFQELTPLTFYLLQSILQQHPHNIHFLAPRPSRQHRQLAVQRFRQIEGEPDRRLFLSSRVVTDKLWIAEGQLLHRIEAFVNAAVRAISYGIASLCALIAWYQLHKS